MPDIFKIEGVNKVRQKLKLLETEAKRDHRTAIVVGYTAAYAVHVHENVEMKWRGQKRKGKDGKGKYWDPQGRGQSKFLEKPAREKQRQIATAIRQAYKRGATLNQSLAVGGLLLQRESQLLVPVDTGNLKQSAFMESE